MTKRRTVSFILMLAVVAAMLVGMILPSAAIAAPGIVEVNWSEAVFEGYDSFYGTNVAAYTAGSTLKMQFRVNNDSANDMTINAAVVTFDWGACTPTAPAAFPFVLKAGDYAIFRFECVVPADATNQTLHSYKAEVHYEGMYGPAINSLVNWENVADLNLNQDIAVPGSVTLWDVTPTGAQVISVDKYSVSYYTGAIAWVAPYPGPTGTPYAAYEYIPSASFMAGDGVNTKFRFVTNPADLPLAADSVKVVKAVGTPINSVTKVDTGWTVDLATGTLTFATAPAAWEGVGVFYKNYNSFLVTGSAVAVISADQAAYATAWRRYRETFDTEWFNTYNSGSAIQQMGEAEQLRAQAEIEYREGKFAEAAATMQEAADTVAAAIAAEAALYGAVETGLTGLLTGGGGIFDAYGNKMQAEADAIADQSDAEVSKLKAEATKAKGYGTFLILVGVFFILVGVAALIMAVTKFMAGRKAPQTT